jgi:hypothetical protein
MRRGDIVFREARDKELVLEEGCAAGLAFLDVPLPCPTQEYVCSLCILLGHVVVPQEISGEKDLVKSIQALRQSK